MTQRPKTVNRKVAIALGILCVATLIALNFSIITYYSAMTSKNNQIQTLNDQLVIAQTQIANSTHPTPNLVSVDLHFSDNRSDPDAPFLQVTGYVINVGNAPANNCVLHVSAVRNDNSTAVDNSANIASLEAGAYTKIDAQFSYTGTPLTSFSSNLEWGT
jgi:hypothetical protein